MVTSIPFLLAKIADDSDFFKLREMANVHDGWNLDYDKGGIKIWSKNVSDATVKMVKIRSTFLELNSNDLYNTLLDAAYRKEWDPHMMISYDIGHLNPNNGVSYYAVSCPPPLRSRDFVLQSSWLDRGSEFFIINHSICHKDHPPRKNFIRAVSYFTGYFIQNSNLSGCEMSFVSQTDPQGLIPTWLVNKCTQIFAPRFVKQLERAANKYSEWKKLNNPTFCPWIYPEQITSPKITTADCVPCEEEINSSFFRYLSEKVSKKAPTRKSDTSFVTHRHTTVDSAALATSKSANTKHPLKTSLTSTGPATNFVQKPGVFKDSLNEVKVCAHDPKEKALKLKPSSKKIEKKDKEKGKDDKKKGQQVAQKKKGKPSTPPPETAEEEEEEEEEEVEEKEK